ncbi:MAG: DUF4012 domain-containing protein [Dehalococcoidia bacterium]|nr:DUF4012 domain-containing protein [Dehalococcoidia bacterium]
MRSRDIIGIALLVALLAMVAVEGYRYVRIYNDLAEGRDLLVGAGELMEQKGLDLGTEDLSEATQGFESARGKLAGASDALGSDPLVFAASGLPWIGGQADAAKDIAAIGVDASDMGVEAAAAVRTYQATRDAQGGTLSERVVPVLEAVEPNVAVIDEKLAAVQERRGHIADDGLLAPLSSAVDQLDDHIEELEARLVDYRRATAMAPKVLGYDGPQTYLVLAHDNTEILGTGGFILVYGFLTFDNGRLEQLSFDDVGSINPNWPPLTDGYIDPPRPLQTYLLHDWPMGLAEASWWPDFPTAAQNAIEIYHTNSGTQKPIDGVIGVNFLTLEKLLEVLGPMTVEEYDTTVTSQDVIEQTLIITHPQGTRPWETDRYDFVGYLAQDVIASTLTAGPSKWASMLSALRTVGQEKNLLLYHTDPAVQRLIADFGWDGGLEEVEGDYLMVVDSSLRSTKLNLVVEPRIDMDVSIDAQGNATNVVTVAYANDYSAWSEGKDPQLAGIVIGDGSLSLYGDYLRLLVPEDTSLTQVAEQGTPAGAEDTWSEGGKAILARFFLLPLDANKEIAFTYAVPSVADMGENFHEYHLFVQKQPGTRAIPLTITIHPPPGLKIVSTEVDGEQLEGNPNRIVTDLREDREVVIRYGPRR